MKKTTILIIVVLFMVIGYAAYNIEELTQGTLIKNVVSRKKQMVPCIMDVVEHL